jgi:hypothetical protein
MSTLIEISKKYNDSSFIRSVVSMIPYIGGGLDILLTDKWSKFYQRRVENMLSQLSMDIKAVEDKVDEKYLNSEEFLDVVVRILKDATQTRLDDKRKLYSKVMRDSISNMSKTAETEALIEIISNLNEHDLIFINRIDTFTKVDSNQHEKFTADGISAYNPSDFSNINEIVRVLYRFSYLGLLDYETTKLTLRKSIQFSKTPLFNRIIDYLKE